jgi:hypothetical protein
MRVAKVSRKSGHALLHIHPGSIPGQEGPHREAGAKVMQARTMTIGGAAQADLA